MMTKKERAAVDKEINALKLRVALRWTDPARPDIPPPLSNSSVTHGFTPAYDRVEQACSSCMYHGFGTAANSQGTLHLHSTRLAALKELRHRMELRFAAELRKVDDWILIEEATPTPLEGLSKQ